MRSNLVDLRVTTRRETQKAVEVSDGSTEAWIPRSQAEFNGPDMDGCYEMTIPEWLAKEKGFI